ncbi:MAG: cytochrome P450 [Pseudomonadota bacterium]
MDNHANQLPVVVQDPTDPTFVADPYAHYAAWRALGDFVYWRDYGMPMATTHAAVSRALRHTALGRAVPEALRPERQAGLDTFNALEQHSLLEIEPPDHTRLRRAATGAFTGLKIALIAPVISRLADRLIDTFPETPFDLIEHYSKPLAAQTITQFLGVDPAMAGQLQAWSNDMVAMYQARRDADVEARAEAAARAFADFIGAVIAEKGKTPGTDFLSDLVAFQASGGMTQAELTSTAILLLNAGHEATVHAVGNAVPLLVDFENRPQALSPEGIGGTVEECLRLRPPLHLFKRFVYTPDVMEDVAFEPNDEIGCLLASACHDDAVWPGGDTFDPFRPRLRHLAFGVGLHACLGAALARLEMQIALHALFSRCPDLRIAETPVVANLYHFHGFERLMVSVR